MVVVRLRFLEEPLGLFPMDDGRQTVTTIAIPKTMMNYDDFVIGFGLPDIDD